MADHPTSNGIYYRRIERKWPVILFAGIAGGVLGLLLGLAEAPRYEAMAAVSIAIDYSRSLPLDESTERQALNRVLDLIMADETIERAIHLAPQSALAAAEIRSKSDFKKVIRLRDLRGRWELLAAAEDPQTASALADAWAESAIENAEASLVHAWQASELQAQVFGLGCSLEESTAGSAMWSCRRAGDGEEEVLLESLLREAELSNGLIPPLSVSFLESADIPSDPSTQSEATYALAGTIAGLVVGTLAVALQGSSDERDREQSAD